VVSRKRSTVVPTNPKIGEQSLRRMIHENADGMLVIDPDGVVRFANPAAERLLGRPARSLEGSQLGFPAVPDEPSEIEVLVGESPRTAEMRAVMIEWEGEPALLGSLRDVTDRKRAEAKFRGLLESAPYAVLIVDERGRVVLANAQAEVLLGYTHSELLELTVESLIPERFREPHADYVKRFFDDPHPRPMKVGLELYALRRDGREIPVEISLGPLEAAEGTLVSAAIQDVSQLKRAETVLREAEERFRRAFEEAPIGMAMLHPDGRFVQVNDALCDITGYSRDQLEATSLDAITHPDDLGTEEQEISRLLTGETAGHRLEKRLVHAAQRPVLVAMQATLLRDSAGDPLSILAQIQDITDRRRYEDRLRHLADHDALTGLLNRRSFEREVEAHRARTERYGGGGATIMLDLDHFKFINDTLGHSAGDETIARAANVLRSRLRETDTLARLGGDEFAVLLPRADAPTALLVAQELLEALRAETVELGGHPRPLSASAGIALFESGEDFRDDDVLVKADLAMYDAKNAGRDRAELYATDEHESSGMKGRVTWAQRIGEALHHGGFTLLAQPIVDLATGHTSQHELLLRMRDERGDLVPPGAFLYIAERLGMVQEIDRWVTEQAISLVADGRRRGQELTLEVNLSGLSIGDPQLLALISRELKRTNVPPQNLIFEVTETAAVINITRAGQFARSLTRLGCRFALDDFGAGYGSFYYLKHLPFDFLKIDGEFVKGCRNSQTDRLLIKAAVDIAAGMGKRTIAEFVGDQQTTRLLARLGVDYGQGFHLGRPAPLESAMGLA
jgi:diguanylate cyclase (GGDEF)-like protein/PAS domain S-box-containing protein